MNQPYSDGPVSFEHILSRVELSALDAERVTVTEAASRVVTCFRELEACFTGVSASHPARLARDLPRR